MWYQIRKFLLFNHKAEFFLQSLSIFVSLMHLSFCVLVLSTRGHRAITVARWLCLKAWQTKRQEEVFLKTEI